MLLPFDGEWWTVDAVICAIGTTRAKTPARDQYRAIDFDYPLGVARAALSHGATRFALVSSMGAHARSRFFYTRTKGELEEAIERLGYPSLTIVRPGFIGGDRKEHRAMEHLMGRLLRFAEPLLPPVARISPAGTIAAILMEAALSGVAGTHHVDAARIARIAKDERP